MVVISFGVNMVKMKNAVLTTVGFLFFSIITGCTVPNYDKSADEMVVSNEHPQTALQRFGNAPLNKLVTAIDLKADYELAGKVVDEYFSAAGVNCRQILLSSLPSSRERRQMTICRNVDGEWFEVKNIQPAVVEIQ